MTRQCVHCKRVTEDDNAVICQCGTLLPSKEVDPPTLSLDQEARIADLVADRLWKRKGFKWGIANRAAVWFVGALGLWLLFFFGWSLPQTIEKLRGSINKNVSNQLAGVTGVSSPLVVALGKSGLLGGTKARHWQLEYEISIQLLTATAAPARQLMLEHPGEHSASPSPS